MASLSEPSLEHLRVLTVLAQSAHAIVYLAEWATPIGGLAAVKRGLAVPSAPVAGSATTGTLLDLDHPHVATVFDAGVDAAGRPYAVTDYVAGLPIDRYCDVHRLGLDDRLQLVLQLAETLVYAHTRGLPHRNLKSSNVLVTRSSRVSVLDFRASLPYPAQPGRSDTASLGLLVVALLAGLPDGHSRDPRLEDLRDVARRAVTSTDAMLTDVCQQLARIAGR